MNRSSRSKYAFSRPIEHDEAIVTSIVRYGESDCIARLFCRKAGRVSAFVKGGLKPSKRRGSAVQAPSRAVVGLRGRNNTQLLSLAQIDIAPYTLELATNLRSYGWACYLAELVEIFIAEQEKAEGIFDVLDATLRLIAQRKATACHLRAFELKLLCYCGYLPELSQVVDFPGRKVAAYDPYEGFLLAEPKRDSVRFDESAQMAAINLVGNKPDSLPDYDESILRQVGQIFASRLRQVKSEPLKSIEFLRKIGV